ncbi:hypothetical protein LTR12_012333 [Friedmanniomyces endolithicus]|nr:hypothetical protein LTR12_012333 [Friedmanniomyces endolithicus]
MRLLSSLAIAGLSLGSAFAANWGFEDATLTVSSKGAGVGSAGVKEKLTPNSPLTSYAVTLPAADTLKIVLTATEGKTGKRPHQAFLTLHDTATGLEESFPFSLKDSGKGKVEVTQKDLPYQLLTSKTPLKASLVLASFGSSTPYASHAFDLALELDSAAPPATPPASQRYTSKPEIPHIFKAEPGSPPKVISFFFTLCVLATLPVLFGAWALLGANVDHLGKAFGAAPVSHGLFMGSVVAMEGVFFMYYTSWNLFQMLPVAAVVGTVAYVSGSRALTEVQERRLAGER